MTDLITADVNIRQLYARYAESIWRKDPEAFGACLAEDVEWRISGEVMKGRAAAVAMIRTVLPQFRWCSINFKQPIIDVSGDEITARTFFIEQSVFNHGRTFTAMGTYYDRIVIDGDRWRFKWRLFQTHYAGSPDLSSEFFEPQDFGPSPAMPALDQPTFRRSTVIAQ